MSDDQTESDDYKRVFGVKFYQPKDLFGLNKKSVTEDRLHIFTIVASIIPFIGMVLSLSSMIVGLENRDTNPFRLDEHFWKAGVIGFVVHTISVIILLIGISLL